MNNINPTLIDYLNSLTVESILTLTTYGNTFNVNDGKLSQSFNKENIETTNNII